jgi:glycosyltransferase involved in cell wall biosynthesis
MISWTPHNRASSLGERLRGTYHVPAERVVAWPWPARFLIQAVATVWQIVRRRPAVILFTNPPFLAGLSCLLGSRFIGAHCWADCHSGVYNNPRWSRFAAMNAYVTRRCTGVIFHNEEIAEAHRSEARHAVVMTIFSMKERAKPASPTLLPAGVDRDRPIVVIPSSFEFDEPVDEILAMAEVRPDYFFVLTGSAPELYTRRSSANVLFSGWLEEPEYDNLFDSASVIVALTTRDETMQNGMLEALQHARPVITSNTTTLTRWAEGIPGVVVSAPRAEELAAALDRIMNDLDAWQEKARDGHNAASLRASSELCTLKAAIAEQY